MTTFAQAVQNTMQPSFTANGMVTNQSSLDPNVDLFFAIGSSRGKDLTGAFARAYAAEPDVAMKILFWARDARGGAGERHAGHLRPVLQAGHGGAAVRHLVGERRPHGVVASVGHRPEVRLDHGFGGSGRLVRGLAPGGHDGDHQRHEDQRAERRRHERRGP